MFSLACTTTRSRCGPRSPAASRSKQEALLSPGEETAPPSGNCSSTHRPVGMPQEEEVAGDGTASGSIRGSFCLPVFAQFLGVLLESTYNRGGGVQRNFMKLQFRPFLWTFLPVCFVDCLGVVPPSMAACSESWLMHCHLPLPSHWLQKNTLSRKYHCRSTAWDPNLKSGVPVSFSLTGLCGGVYNATSTPETATSPYFPNAYPPFIFCRWVIDAPPEQQVKLAVQELHLSSSQDCSQNYLEFQDTPLVSQLALLLRIAG